MSLLDKGVRLNIHDEVDHSATNSIIVVYSKYGCLSNAVSLQGGSHPLWLVSEQGRTDLVDLFLQQGADVDLPTAVRYMLILVTNNSMNELDS